MDDLDSSTAFRDRDGLLHRRGGPAIIYPSGKTVWYCHGRIHRSDGPAVNWLKDDQNWRSQWWLWDRRFFNFDVWLEKNYMLTDEQKVLIKLEYG